MSWQFYLFVFFGSVCGHVGFKYLIERYKKHKIRVSIERALLSLGGTVVREDAGKDISYTAILPDNAETEAFFERMRNAEIENVTITFNDEKDSDVNTN